MHPGLVDFGRVHVAGALITDCLRVRMQAKQARQKNTNTTRAEIKSCCRHDSLLNVPLVQAVQNVVPVAVTRSDKFEAFRPLGLG